MPSIAEWLGRPDAVPTLLRWQQEAEKHARAGDYDWMADRIAPGRVLEVGCGAGFGTIALRSRGSDVLLLEPDADCLAMAVARCIAARASDESGAPPKKLQVDVRKISDLQHAEIAAFAPQRVVCWMMGAPDQELDPRLPSAQAVQQYREAVHRQVAELAATLPSVDAVHLVDRTAFPWKIKDTARETLVHYHQTSTFAGLPFSPRFEHALYRKLDQGQWPAPPGQRGTPGLVPVLASLVAHRE